MRDWNTVPLAQNVGEALLLGERVRFPLPLNVALPLEDDEGLPLSLNVMLPQVDGDWLTMEVSEAVANEQELGLVVDDVDTVTDKDRVGFKEEV